MTDQPLSVSTIKRRQVALLAAGVALLGIGTAVSVSLTAPHPRTDRAVAPTSTILAPGAQVDAHDAWRGQADAQLNAMAQTTHELDARAHALDVQGREMMARLHKLETAPPAPPSADLALPPLTSLPPSPVLVPARAAGFGPDRAGTGLNEPARLPSPPGSAPDSPRVASGIVGITLSDGATPITAKAPAGVAENPRASRDPQRYLPSGTFTRALLLGGLDAPTGGQAQRNPQPVLLRLMDNGFLPNAFRARVKACFVVGAGYGEVSAERAYIRTESLSCVTREGVTIDVPIKGYVAGEDGKAGMRGRMVSKQGQILANALLAGIASGIGSAFQQSATTYAVSPLGSTSTVASGKQLEAGMGTGMGKALDRLAQYYISLAEKVFPVIEIDAGRTVDVVLTQGIALPGTLDAAAETRLPTADLDAGSVDDTHDED